MVLVHDVVAGPQVGEALQRPAEPRVRAGSALAEHLRVREQDDAELPREESAPDPCDREHEPGRLGQGRAGLEQLGIQLAQQRFRPHGLAAVGERDHDSVAGADEAREVVLGFGQAPGSHGRPLRLERELLPGRKR